MRKASLFSFVSDIHHNDTSWYRNIFLPEHFVISSKHPFFSLGTFICTINYLVLLSVCPCTWQNRTHIYLKHMFQRLTLYTALNACIAIIKINWISSVNSYILMPCWLDSTHWARYKSKFIEHRISFMQEGWKYHCGYPFLPEWLIEILVAKIFFFFSIT